MKMNSLIFAIAALLCVTAIPGWGIAFASGDASSSSDSRSESTENILNQISRQSGYRLELIGDLPSPSFQTSATAVSQPDDLVPRIRRVLYKAGVLGYVLETDEIEKTVAIIVTGFGNGSPTAGVNGAKVGVPLEDTSGLRPSGASLDSQKQLLLGSLASLRRLHRQQYEDLQDDMSKPEFEDMTGMQNVERWMMHAEQTEQYTRIRNDPNSVSELDRVTNQQLRKMHREQQIEVKMSPNSIDPLDGVSNLELWGMHKEQYEQFQRGRER